MFLVFRLKAPIIVVWFDDTIIVYYYYLVLMRCTTTLFLFCFCFCLVSLHGDYCNKCTVYNGGLVPDIILLTHVIVP